MIVTEGRVRIEWLGEYSQLERMYIAARTTRTFDYPEQIIRDSIKHLVENWGGNRIDRSGKSMSEWKYVDLMKAWLEVEIVKKEHNSVLEFAGQELMFHISGVSLGTLRDVDRHRLFSYEEYTTRALSENMAERIKTKGLRGENDLEDLFYVHPQMLGDCGTESKMEYLYNCWAATKFYIESVKNSKHPHAPDMYRGIIPLALRTPFCMAANGRAWSDATAKRTCAYCGHREYVDLYRILGSMLQKLVPTFAAQVERHCPMGKATEGCCRAKWIEGLKNG